MASSALVKTTYIVIFVCMMVGLPRANAAITCGAVTESLAPCVGYLRTGQGPSPACCNGVKTLKEMAVTVDDRRAACRCMKSAAAAISAGFKPEYTAALPSKCGVSIPGPIGPQTDCSKIH